MLQFGFVQLRIMICCGVAFPLGRLTCVLSALPTSPWSKRPRNRLHPPSPALSGRLQRGWWFCFIVSFKFVAFVEKLFQCICDFSLSFSWQKGDRPDNDLRWAMQHPDKKNMLTVGRSAQDLLLVGRSDLIEVSIWRRAHLGILRQRTSHQRQSGPKLLGQKLSPMQSLGVET